MYRIRIVCSDSGVGEGNGSLLQYSCLENPVDRGAAVHGVPQNQTRLKRLSMHACIGEGNGSPLQYSCLENPRDRGAWSSSESAHSWLTFTGCLNGNWSPSSVPLTPSGATHFTDGDSEAQGCPAAELNSDQVEPSLKTLFFPPLSAFTFPGGEYTGTYTTMKFLV